jgi:CO/xanthine dehydrogenase Mo-binding subunit
VAPIAVQVLGMPVEAMEVSSRDTEDVAWDFVTEASRSVQCTGKAAYNAARPDGWLEGVAPKRADAAATQLRFFNDNFPWEGDK